MRRLLIATAASAMLAAAPAQAHIQVSPAEAAPGDPVLFELLVPNERSARTIEVRLKIPASVVPFSYEEPAGWTRHLTLARNGAPDVVRWRGRLAADGFARFAFLASTPTRPGTLAWKAIQRYSDGTKVAWIGSPGSRFPAAITVVKRGVARQNAGGEGSPGSAATGTAPASAPAATGDDDSPLALILGAAGLVVGTVALILTLTRSRRAPTDV
jgi:uncharacterized protein YcnI